MAFINVGSFVDGVRPKTKKALREAVADDPNMTRVHFDATSVFDTQARYSAQHTVATDDVLVVVGPDPYNNRKWYANVKNGKVT